jgi:hypothetical protein
MPLLISFITHYSDLNIENISFKKNKIEKAFWFHLQFFCMSSSFKVLGLKHNHALHHALSFPGYFQKDLISLTWKKKGLYKALHFWNVFSSCSTWFNHIAHIYMSNQKSKYFIGFYMIRSLRSQLYESLVISCLMSSEMPGESKMYNLLERNNSLLLCFHSCMYMSQRAS